MENTKNSDDKTFKDKIKKVLKWLAIPFVFIGLGLLKFFSLKKDIETKKDIKDTEKEIKDLKKQTEEAKEQFDDREKQLDDSISKTEETVEQILSEKQDRDKAAKKFFK